MFSHSQVWLGLSNNAAVAFIRNFDGVAIFFVVSGFLISKSWLNPGTSLAVFADHRIRRIYPALWVNIFGLLLLIGVSGCIVISTRNIPWLFYTLTSGSDVIGGRFNGDIFRPGFYSGFPSGVLWTIPVELGFYILTPLALAKYIPSRTGLMISICCWAAASLAIHFYWDAPGDPYATPKYFWIFLFGASINLYWDKLRPFLEGKGIFWLAAFSFFSHAMNTRGILIYYANPPTVISIFATAFLGLTAISMANSFFSISWLLKGRDFSYGVYLWHMPVIWTFRGFEITGNWLIAPVAYIIVIALASLSWHYIERPVLNRKMKTNADVNRASFAKAALT